MTEAAKYSPTYWKLVRASLKEDLSDEEFEVLKYKAQTLELDPLMGHLFPVKRKNRRTGRDQVEVQTNVDAQRLLADRTKQLVGITDPEFTENGGDYPTTARVVVRKLVFRGEGLEPAVAEFPAVAYWSEYYPGDGGAGFMYRNKPHTMLGKCAEALALRKAFPQETGGLYTAEEMAQAIAEDEGEGSRPRKRSKSRQEVTQSPREALRGVEPGTIQLTYGNEGTKGKAISELKDAHLKKIYDWSMNAERHASFMNSHAIEIEAMRRELVRRGHIEYRSQLDDELAEEERMEKEEKKPKTAEERNEEERREFNRKKQEAKEALRQAEREAMAPASDPEPTENGELPL